MHNNYYFLKQLTPELEQDLQNSLVVDIYSQNKDEFIIWFRQGEHSRYLVAHLTGSFTCLALPEDHRKARKNTASVFSSLLNKKLLSVGVFENERAIYLTFEDNLTLVLKLFGRQSNAILFRQQDPIELFKKTHKTDLKLTLKDYQRPIKQDHPAILAALPDIRKVYPTFHKSWLIELGNSIDKTNKSEALKYIDDFVYKLEHPSGYRISEDEKAVTLHICTNSTKDMLASPTEALTHFYFQFLRRQNFNRQRTKMLNDFEKQIAKTEMYIAKSTRKRDSLATDKDLRRLADLLMANLHNVPPNSAAVELIDFYTGTPVKIKLNAKLSAQANAERFYKKAKNQNLELANINKAITGKKIHLAKLKEQYAAIEEASDSKTLKALSREATTKKDALKLPFKKFNLGEYTVLVGNNARQNDLLTLKYATKEDLFFHAKDVTGSHVILKKISGRDFPKAIIENTAMIAAYYSKRKNDTLCPVGYTQKKYVRKPKGAPAGLVLVEKEKVILVSPGLPSTNLQY